MADAETSRVAGRLGRALVVTADDFGFGWATSAGIIRAHREGPVTATSVMTVTGDHVKASVPLLDATREALARSNAPLSTKSALRGDAARGS